MTKYRSNKYSTGIAAVSSTHSTQALLELHSTGILRVSLLLSVSFFLNYLFEFPGFFMNKAGIFAVRSFESYNPTIFIPDLFQPY